MMNNSKNDITTIITPNITTNTISNLKSNSIDLSDPLTFYDVITNVRDDKYQFVNDWFNDIQKTLVYLADPKTFLIKVSTRDGNVLRQIRKTSLKEQLSFVEPQFNLQAIDSEDIIQTEKGLKQKRQKKISLYDYVIQNKDHISYQGLCLSNDKSDQNYLAMFNKFPYAAIKNEELLKIYFTHIQEVICKNNQRLFKFVLDLFAFYIQRPLERSNVILLIQGESGNGKDMFVAPIIELMKSYAKKISHEQDIFGRFNSAIELSHLIVADDLYCRSYATKTQIYKIGNLLSSGFLDIRSKYEKSRRYLNNLNFIILTGPQDGQKLMQIYSPDQNGPVVLPIRSAKKRDSKYYATLQESFQKQGFYEALMWFLENRDISQFDPRKLLK